MPKKLKSFKKRSKKMLRILGVLQLALMLPAEHHLIGLQPVMKVMSYLILVDCRLLSVDPGLPLLSPNLLLLVPPPLRPLLLERL